MTGNTGVRRAETHNADDAEAAMRPAEEPPRTLPGYAVRYLREAMDAARTALEPHQWRGKYREMAAAQDAIRMLDNAFAYVQPQHGQPQHGQPQHGQPIPQPTPQDTAETKGD